jgi:hypothetical protein
MPRKRRTGGMPSKRPIERYEHSDKKRINNPPVGLVIPETDPILPTHKVLRANSGIRSQESVVKALTSMMEPFKEACSIPPTVRVLLKSF